ncbi:hypothetical protein L3Q82_002037 [Scortum barcoo]|uniref:Uncharacterized protein n=1 Tax=Scortum barcoo TaxID=214431 RepID=A0ACB8W115_9TELE|nr:hypothetical protein L3Q82_002037 [Scortum barcoo]
MTQKSSNAVAVEKRMDLASLFCMIGRHGPAVAVAVIAVLSVLAGFIIYRSVRGKRRKATADGDGRSPAAERDATEVRPSPEEARTVCVESTDVSDEGLLDVRDDTELIQSDLKIRHRRAASEKAPPSYSPRKSDTQAPENKSTNSDDTGEILTVRDSFKVTETCAEEASQSLQSEMVVEDAVDRYHGATDDITEDVIEEVHDNDECLTEPVISDENHKEEKTVLKAEWPEDEDVTTDRDVSDKKTKQEEENFQHSLNHSMCFKQPPHTSENGDDDRLQDNKAPLEANSMESDSQEPAIHSEDVPISCICDYKEEEFKEENPDGVDHSHSLCNHCLSPVEEKKKEAVEAEVECVDCQLIPQQAEMFSLTSEQEANLPSIQQDQCDHVMDEMMPPIRDSDTYCGLAGEVTEEVVHEDHLNKLSALKSDAPSPQCDKQEVEDNGLLCDQEDGVHYVSTDQVKEEMLSSESIVACREECDSLSVAPSTGVPSLSIAVKTDNHDEVLSDVTIDSKAQIPGISDIPDLSSDFQQPEKEDKTTTFLVEDTDSTILIPQVASNETENHPERNENGTSGVRTEECNDEVRDPHVQSCYEDQQNVQMIRNEAFDVASTAAAPDIEGCDGDNTPIVAEEISHPHVSTGYKDQQSVQLINNEVPDETEDHIPPTCQINLLSFEQSELRDNDISSPGVDEESGISSMAVSPDSQYTVSSVINKATGSMVFGPYPSHRPQPPQSERTDWTKYESFAANEDMFGHEIEDSYHRELDQFMAQISTSITVITDELKKQPDMTAAIEVVEIKEKKAPVSVEKKEETKDEEKEEDYEKTEISIMEATMDNNEWMDHR